MARTDPDPFDGDVLGDAWFADDELAELGSSGSGAEDAWVHARNRRRRARLRVIAALLVVLILFPIVITFVQRVLP
jgi:hypothetical protein